MFEYFYNEILRRTIISFGTLFNDISIKKTDSGDDVFSVVKVPLAYGPTQKFLDRFSLTRLSSIFDFNCIKSMPVSCKIFNLDSEFDAKIIGKFDFNIDLVLLIN